MLTLESLSLVQGDFSLSADFNLAPGSVTAVIGPSGAGKSTLLAAIAGFLEPASGRILWHGRDITDSSPSMRPVSMIFQDNNLFPHMDLLANVTLGGSTARRPPSDVTGRAMATLADVGLGGFERRKPAEVSGGQQSRAALARALMSDRPFLLLDEPFAALGPALRSDMLKLTTDMAAARGAGILMVTHDPEDARNFARDIVFVNAGRADAPVETRSLLANPPAALAAYLG